MVQNKIVSSNTTELLDIAYPQQLTVTGHRVPPAVDTVNGTPTNRPGLSEEQENTAASCGVGVGVAI
jgi:hypothetical protein